MEPLLYFSCATIIVMNVSWNQDNTFVEQHDADHFNREEIFAKRLQRINETCQKYGLSPMNEIESEALSLQAKYYRIKPKQVKLKFLLDT